MGLLSIFKRKSETAAVNEPADAVQKARSRARQRLIGAAVLLGIGVVGFPLVFETRPRPIPIDIPIEIPRKEGAPALAMPSARSPAAPAAPAAPQAHRSDPVAVAAPTPAHGVPPRDEVITETREDAGLVVPPPARPAPAVRTSEPAHTSPPERTPKPASKPAADTKPSSGDHGDGARARALLDGKPPSKPEAARFVLQVGAFADAAVAHEARLKVEKLGLKTYTQVANTADGNRIRVRVGPFGTRDEADRALAKARSAGLSAVVLTL